MVCRSLTASQSHQDILRRCLHPGTASFCYAKIGYDKLQPLRALADAGNLLAEVEFSRLPMSEHQAKGIDRHRFGQPERHADILLMYQYINQYV